MPHHLSYLRSPLIAEPARSARIYAPHPRFQFFWQDYQDRSYLTALQHLAQLRKAGKIRNLGLCNFDTRRTEEICVELGPGYIVSNQVAVRVTPQSGRGALADMLYLIVLDHRRPPAPRDERPVRQVRIQGSGIRHAREDAFTSVSTLSSIMTRARARAGTVRGPSHRPVARQTGARAVLGPIESLAAKGNAPAVVSS